MKYTRLSEDFELESTEFADTLTFRRSGARLTLGPNELEELFKFLCPLYEDTILASLPRR